MYNPIHDRISHDAAAKAGMPFGLFVLGTEDSRVEVVANLKDLQKVFHLHLRGDLYQPFIHNEQMIGTIPFDKLADAGSCMGRQIEFFQHLRHSDISGFVKSPACFFCNGTGKVGLSGAGVTVDDDVACVHQVGFRRQCDHPGLAESSRLKDQCVDISIGISELCRADQPFGPFTVLLIIKLIDRQR